MQSTGAMFCQLKQENPFDRTLSETIYVACATRNSSMHIDNFVEKGTHHQGINLVSDQWIFKATQ